MPRAFFHGYKRNCAVLLYWLLLILQPLYIQQRLSIPKVADNNFNFSDCHQRYSASKVQTLSWKLRALALYF